MVKNEYTIADTDEGVKRKINPAEVPWWTSSRLALAVLGFFGFINVYALRVNMSVAIVCMVNQTALKIAEANSSSNDTSVKIETDQQCGLMKTGASNETSSGSFQDGEFEWSKTVQGLILGSFFWGYIVTQIPGGWLATKIGGKRVYGFCMLGATVATFLTPVAAQTSYIFLIVLRIIIGFSSGVCYPSMHTLWGHWAPPLERSKLVAFTYAGAQVGNVITFPLAGLLCKYGFAGGWPSIFYVLGILSSVWFILWMIFVSDSPTQHKRISKIEKDYIVESLSNVTLSADKPHEEKPLVVPWCSMFSSIRVWAILVANLTTDWGLYFLLTSIPLYMNEVLKLDISTNGLYSALPYIAFWLMINIAGWLADFIQSKGCLSMGLTRKAFTNFGMIVPAIMLIILGYIDCTQPGAAVTLLVLGVSLTGFQYSGWVVNHMDIAPAFAGILFGISNSIAAVTGFLSPVVVNVITKDKTREQWQIVFYIAAAIYGIGALFYTAFASGEVQPWAKPEENMDLEINITELQPLGNGGVKGETGKENSVETC